MFSDLWSLMTLDVSHFDTSNVTSFEAMFYNMYGPHKLNYITYGTNFVNKTWANVFRMCQANKPQILPGMDISKKHGIKLYP